MVTAFQQRVYGLCRQIPMGRVTTYKIIAEKMGVKAYRAVGQALNKNPYAPRVPCHRVIGSDGTLGGFAHGPGRKKSVLRKEGIRFEGNRIKDFEAKIFRF